MNTPLNLPRIRLRLTKYLASNQDAFDRILCHSLQDNGRDPQQIVLITGINLVEVRRLLREEMSGRDYGATIYATSKPTTSDWRELGLNFLHSIPQVTPEEAEFHCGFIVQCMRWGRAK